MTIVLLSWIIYRNNFVLHSGSGAIATMESTID